MFESSIKGSKKWVKNTNQANIKTTQIPKGNGRKVEMLEIHERDEDAQKYEKRKEREERFKMLVAN